MNQTSQQALDEFFPAYRKALAAFLLAAFLGSPGIALVVLPVFVRDDLFLLMLTLPFSLLGLLMLLGSMVVCVHSIGSIGARVRVYPDCVLVKWLWSHHRLYWDQIAS